MISPAEPRRAAIVGTGLIGGSVGLALRRQGWWVTGVDHDEARAARAAELGALDEVGEVAGADVAVIATPVGAVVDAARAALDAGVPVVTDVGSVKAPITETLADPRFVGGHPMAGSEQEGIEGADPDLFRGATWVLTPDENTAPAAFAIVGGMVRSLGAEVIAVPPAAHDRLVAMVSHVPHLTAATLMSLASERADEHRALLRLAAGGFRDMTRIAAGHPGIWPDICSANGTAIAEVFDDLIAALQRTRDLVAAADRRGLLDALEAARTARVNLPARGVTEGPMAVVRVPVPDRPGVLAEVTTLASELEVNIADIEIAHSAEGEAGVLIVVVPAAASERLVSGLVARAYRPSTTRLDTDES
ncbi:MAG TPA: prephenate dehydrogenase/arogenate dehydrogenase family protein [Acidimicrobiales bacterium]|jgi:prephenate dehydrogenase